MQSVQRRGVARGAAPATLVHDEGVRLDGDRLVALYAELGEAGAEAVICRAMEDLATALADLQRLAMACDLVAMPGRARLLARVAGDLGMSSLCRVAEDAALCAGRGDMPALAAVLARLVRIGDRSLTAVWDLQDRD
ncbi:hypothetical protein GVY41_18145 [Frigidibacter albus]|uniref:Hpt domain-containing protein n=1 Tax=Frigidibacter albus TaxID=1465486 RepID=A0A6L8VNK0_9RHOB|nr:hypothetical protein [Frigidibacter albus]MZQ91042.1 hypothetical protein [Frigidibacter albus]NBE32927.1 hypothetical protein [Frigidibacter albus]GGH62115.1 hypothetical protein GCM10011341_35980 [Frigidibacter albus]